MKRRVTILCGAVVATALLVLGVARLEPASAATPLLVTASGTRISSIFQGLPTDLAVRRSLERQNAFRDTVGWAGGNGWRLKKVCNADTVCAGDFQYLDPVSCGCIGCACSVNTAKSDHISAPEQCGSWQHFGDCDCCEDDHLCTNTWGQMYLYDCPGGS